MSTAIPRPRVVLTDPLHPDAFNHLAEQAEIILLDPQLSREAADIALRAAIKTAQGLIVRRQLPPDIFDADHDLRGVVRHGVGVDFIPVASATTHKLPVANTPEVNANAVAEYAIGGMLAATRRFGAFDKHVRDGRWDARRNAGELTFELRGRAVGVVGYGAIGKRIGEIASLGFGMQVAAHTRTLSRLPPGVQGVDLQTLFSISDFIVLACPLTDATRGMINAGVFAHAKPGATLINVARGPVVKEADLAAALETGRIAAAVLDVFEVQPLPMASPLRGHPRVILTPHLAGTTQDAERAMGMLAVQTQLSLIKGERPANIVNAGIYT